MTKKRLIILLLGVLLLLALSVYFLLWKNGRDEGGLQLYGNIDIRQVELGFRVSGRLKALHFEEGDSVEAGEVMALLDDEPYRLAQKEAAARALSVRERLDNAGELYQRRETLIHERSISTEEYQQSYYNRKVLEANLEEAEAALASGNLRLEDTVLKAPAAGIVTTRVREPGSIVAAGMAVYSLTLEKPLFARAYVDEKDLGLVYYGMKATITTDTAENPSYRGHVGYISPVAEFTPKNVEAPNLRTSLVYQLRIVVDDPGRTLKRGMPVTITLAAD